MAEEALNTNNNRDYTWKLVSVNHTSFFANQNQGFTKFCNIFLNLLQAYFEKLQDDVRRLQQENEYLKKLLVCGGIGLVLITD